MLRDPKSKKILFAIVVLFVIIANLYTLSVAYPTMQGPLILGDANLHVFAVAIPTANNPLNINNANLTSFATAVNSPTKSTANTTKADLPRDFSVYYIAAWRMLHNPSQIFTTGTLKDGEPPIYPYLTPYKYLPSFLLLISPLTFLSYYQAFWVFDTIQFALLPLIALLLYKLLENKNPLLAFLILVAVLMLPYPMIGRGLSVSYFMQWAEGQAKVLLTFLLLFSFYLGYRGKPALSGIAFALGAFDVRFTILALPLFLFYNHNNMRKSIPPLLIVLGASNIMILYSGVAQGFFNMLLSYGGSTPFYTPAYIPLIMIGCLSALNAKGMIDQLKELPSKISIHKSKLDFGLGNNRTARAG
jgi:hypothetical protein